MESSKEGKCNTLLKALHLAAEHHSNIHSRSLLVFSISKREEFIHNIKTEGFLRQSLKHDQEAVLWKSLEFVNLGQTCFKQAIGCCSHVSCFLQTGTIQHWQK